MIFKNKKLLLIAMLFGIVNLAFAQQYFVGNNQDPQGFSITEDKGSSMTIVYSTSEFSMIDVPVDGQLLKSIKTPGIFLPNDAGAPDLPGTGRYVAIPQGADVQVNLLSLEQITYENIEMAPAPVIPLDTDSGPLVYSKNKAIFSKDAFYPENIVSMEQNLKIRGVDVIMLGVSPFQYNPVTKELIVYSHIEFELQINGGNGQIGENRLRNRWWDPIIKDAVLNPEALPEVDFGYKPGTAETPDYEYIIITPDDPVFLAWADSIKTWRTLQGIFTGVVTTTEIGGNTTTAIETYVDNAYNTWDSPPAAVLLLGDYGTSTSGINSYIYPHPGGWPDFVSDNRFADVDGDDLPEVVFARITGNNYAQLEVMITKFLDYERNPPTAADFYDHPITALGWQTERWFQICSETVGGYFKHVHGKDPVRINAIYSGTPGSVWSTATNTTTVVNYFGPSGLGYIPATPAELGGFSGGTGQHVVAAINSGSFLLQHRDHGSYSGWGEPDFTSTTINSLTNVDNKLPFIFSINCQTGAFHNTSECFAEKFHRHTYGGENSGALGIIAATEVSYSFVNDTYVWGLFDNMWTDFMPDYGTTPSSRDVLPAFGNAAGKHFLYQSSWPYNTSNKQITYRLFHHHGDAFSTVYAEVPQNLTVNHNAAMLSGIASFGVTANVGSFIALTVNGSIIGTATGTGSEVMITIPPQNPGDVMVVTVTKQNYYRYSSEVDIIPPSGPYVSYHSNVINDMYGNNNGEPDYYESLLMHLTLENQGSAPAYNVNTVLSSSDGYITITDNSEYFGTIVNGSASTVNDAFGFEVAGNIPDQHEVVFDLEITGDADDVWNSSFSILVNAPELTTGNLTIDDASGNGNGKLDPGETADLIIETSNTGHSDSPVALGDLSTGSPYVTINSGPYNFGVMPFGSADYAVFNVSVHPSAPIGTSVTFNYYVTAGSYSASDIYNSVVGQVPVLIIDMDPNNSSATEMETALNVLSVPYDIYTSIPAELDLYTSVFVCLGIYSTNHVLTSTEGQQLADYVNSGGYIYMEGGDTWYYDTQTAVHALFNIDAQADGTSDMGTVLGQAGTITDGMTFNYSGENSWMDHIEPIAPAVSIFQNQSPLYGCGVAYDAGTYRTIGSSFEFGGLDDGTSPSTKTELMNQYLTFFGITGTPLLPPDISINPLSFNVTLAPDEQSTEIMTISNSGEQNLSFSISTGSKSPVKGKMAQNLSQKQKQALRDQPWVQSGTNELDSGSGYPNNYVLPPIGNYGQNENKGEETFGSWDGGTWSGGLRDRGNIYHVTTDVTLEEIRFYLDITSTTELYFVVYEGTAVTGSFTKIAESYVASSGTGTGWYSSGAMNVQLLSGSYYYIATSWSGTATYGRGTETVPITTSFGSLQTGIPGNIAGYPPAATGTNSYTAVSPYYQTIVTSSGPVFNWLVPSPLSGSIAGSGTFDVDVLFDATGLTNGTYIKDLIVSSNDPDQPTIVIPCTLNVHQGISLDAKVILEGPFASGEMFPLINLFGMLPLNQPYNTTPWNYNGTESVGAIPSTDLIDWVLIELRETPGDASTATPATVVARKAAFLHKNGTIVDLDGVSYPEFGVTVSDNLFVVVYHRNHLGVLSAYPAAVAGSQYYYDFSDGEGKVYGGFNAHVPITTGIWGMAAGDGNADGEVDNEDKNEIWETNVGSFDYVPGDFDMNGQVDNMDIQLKWHSNAGRCSHIVK